MSSSNVIYLTRFRKERNNWVEIHSGHHHRKNEMENKVDESEQDHQLLNFKDTILTNFKKIVKDFNSPYIKVNADDLISYCNNIKYLSKYGGTREIVNSPYYINEANKVLKTYCIEDGNYYRYPGEH